MSYCLENIPVHLFGVNDFTFIHFLIQHVHQDWHSIRKLQSDQLSLNQAPKDLQKFEDRLGDQTIIKCSSQNCSQLSIQLKCSSFEMFVIFDERLVHGIQAVICST